MEYRDRLDAAIRLAGVERKALADALGVSVQAIGMLLTGNTKALTAENSARAARFLTVDPHWLATGEGDPRPPLMLERAALSNEAVEHAMEFDKLTPAEKRLWHTLVDAARAARQDPPEDDQQANDEDERLIAEGLRLMENSLTRQVRKSHSSKKAA